MFVLNENSRSKKRSRDSLESCDNTERPTKRKRAARLVGYAGHRPPGFWNSLSKVHLTQGALREFDHRTAQSEQKSLPVRTNCIVASTESRICRLKRFSRHGGPDLTHIRGVSIHSSEKRYRGLTNDIAVCTLSRSKRQHEPVDFMPEEIVPIWVVRVGA